MERKKFNFINRVLQWGLFLCINVLFICKYVPRAGLNPVLCSFVYGVLIVALAILYQRVILPHISKYTARNISIAIIIGIVALIALAIYFIPPLSIRVDRWSATSYFLDALFQGLYPYGVHTHISETNFPSPFPLWHYLNIPFWLIGDVGWIQVFCLLLFLAAVWYYFRSWHILLSVILLICLSPSYWWEIATRSDGVSNILLVLAVILYAQRKPIEMNNQWWLLALMVGCIASTRLSSVIPCALFLFRPWLDINWKKKIGFIAIILGVAIFFIIPYVFWDTTTWVFFERNPFITQTLQGNSIILIVMILLAIFIAYRKQSFNYYISTTAIYIFVFMLISQLALLWSQKTPSTLFDTCCDISYLTLSLPFVIIALVNENK